MFRRRPSADPAPLESGASAVSGKGRPTPKRREAEQARKQRLAPPKDRRAAATRQRQRAREQRELQRKALAGGDTRYLPSRDQGPVRAFCRDFVDSRRSMAEYLLPVLVAVIVMTVVPSLAAWASVLLLAVTLAVAMDTGLLVWRLRKALRERFPEQSTKGATFYTVTRSSQLRRLRLPKPRVSVGQPI